MRPRSPARGVTVPAAPVILMLALAAVSFLWLGRVEAAGPEPAVPGTRDLEVAARAGVAPEGAARPVIEPCQIEGGSPPSR